MSHIIDKMWDFFVPLHSNMKQIEVVAAIIHDDEGRIFAIQRGYGDYKDGWEFPGGKMEAGETPEEVVEMLKM